MVKPEGSGKASNVPIQPRNDLWPDLDRVFQVTNSGKDSVMETREAYVGGAEELIEVAALEASCELEELEESMEGDEAEDDLEEELEACRREILGI